MVSSDEIKSRLEAKRLGQDPRLEKAYESAGFLVCQECGSYYELQKGECPEDFSLECDCGGRLIYQKFLDDPYPQKKSSIGKLLAVLIGIGIALIIIRFCFPFLYIIVMFSFFNDDPTGTIVLMGLVLALIGSGAYSGYYLIKIILKANN